MHPIARPLASEVDCQRDGHYDGALGSQGCWGDTLVDEARLGTSVTAALSMMIPFPFLEFWEQLDA